MEKMHIPQGAGVIGVIGDEPEVRTVILQKKPPLLPIRLLENILKPVALAGSAVASFFFGTRPIVVNRTKVMAGIVMTVVTPLVLVLCAMAFSTGERGRDK